MSALDTRTGLFGERLSSRRGPFVHVGHVPRVCNRCDNGNSKPRTKIQELLELIIDCWVVVVVVVVGDVRVNATPIFGDLVVTQRCTSVLDLDLTVLTVAIESAPSPSLFTPFRRLSFPRTHVTVFFVIRQVLADQALEEGRHKTALGLYKAALACPPPPSSCSSPPPPARHVGDDRSQENNNPAAAAATAAVKGDALHGVGVAMLAAGNFRDARRAFQRWVRVVWVWLG